MWSESQRVNHWGGPKDGILTLKRLVRFCLAIESLRKLVSKLLSILCPASFLLGHELDEFGRLSKAIQKSIALENWVVRKAGGGGLFQPFISFVAVASQRALAWKISPSIREIVNQNYVTGRFSACDGQLTPVA